MATTPLSKRWCAFSLVMLALVLPFEFWKLFGSVSLYDAARYVVDTIAVVGLFGYAFRVQIGPQIVWRIFAPLFILFSLGVAASGVPRLFAMQLPSAGLWIATAVFLSIGAAIVWFMSLALLRYGGWLDESGTRSNAYA